MMFLLPGSWIEQNRHLYQIELPDPSDNVSWHSPISNTEIRMERYKQIRNTARSLGYAMFVETDDDIPDY